MAAAVRSGRHTAAAIVDAALTAATGPGIQLCAITRVLRERAERRAAQIDACVRRGENPGPLAGVPFVVKDLFDVAGLATTAGAAMLETAAPATHDARAIARLEAAGAVLVGTANMDALAYGFATINAQYGTTCNPHDRRRIAGGSSGGSAAAVAAGLVPISLGSDTNGSIRVPAGLCGVYGLKPTHGALPMEGVYPFVESFDDIGPFATSVADLRLAWEALGGEAAGDISRAPRVARLGGWFAANVCDALVAGIDGLAVQLGRIDTIDLPKVDAARSAAFLMTAAEGGTLHRDALRDHALDFDPAVRDRLIAGAMLPASAYFAAQRFRAWFRAKVADVFERYDVLIAPAAGVVAPTIDDPTIIVDGQRVPARAQLGLFTQPISFIGLPVISAPLYRPGALPLGLQLIGRPGSEALLFDFAAQLEAAGVIGTTPPGAGPSPTADDRYGGRR
jgi:aspartyl-tRNA(Asn)/glutamyl-tRNA(Gln) amidotransferase subunit A